MKRIKALILIILLLFCIVFTLAFTVVKITYYTEELVEEMVEEPLASSGRDVCDTIEYTYGYNWIDWQVNPQSNEMTPLLDFMNMEDRTGKFAVRYEFIDEDKYPFEEYQNNTDQVVPEFYSQTKLIELSSMQRVTIAISTKLENPNATYWVYADVQPPLLQFCEMRPESQNTTRTVLTLKKVKKESTLGEYVLSRFKKNNQ